MVAATDDTDAKDQPIQLVEDDTGARFLVYKSNRGLEFDLRFDGSEPWFTYEQMAQVFGVDESTVIRHVQNFLDDGELADATTAEFAVVRQEGGRQVERQI